MSLQVETAFNKQFSSTVYHLAQQKKSRLRSCVRIETITGEEAFFDQLGATTAQEVFDRHGDSPLISTPHSRRRIQRRKFEWGDMVDDFDETEMIVNPKQGYVQAGSMALGRSLDDIIIEAATGTAYTGKTGTTAVTLPSSQQVNVGSAAALTSDILKTVRAKFWANDVDLDDPMNELYFVCTGQQLEDLLNDTEVISADYNTVKALVNGNVDTFMGFKFVRTERVDHDATNDVDTCFAFARSGICLGINKDLTGWVDRRTDKRGNWYAYACMSLGASRMEEEKVVRVDCDRSP